MSLEELQIHIRSLSLEDQITALASALVTNSDLVAAIYSMTSLLGVMSSRCDDELARVCVSRQLRYAATWIDGARDDSVTMLH